MAGLEHIHKLISWLDFMDMLLERIKSADAETAGVSQAIYTGLLKIWNLFLVSGSGPTGFKGAQRGMDSAFNRRSA
jgi:hypothetical protein